MINFVDLSSGMNSEELCSNGIVKVYRKKITLLSGPPESGKTAMSLNLVNDAISRGHKILYFDTELKAIDRAEPHLLKEFYNKNPTLYTEKFKCTGEFDNNGFFEVIIKEKPDVVVLDSIYKPFSDKYKDPRTRAKSIKEFMNKLRGHIRECNCGVVITSQVGRVVVGNNVMKATLGGEGLRHLSDLKNNISFPGTIDDDNKMQNKRIITTDRQEQKSYTIKYGGIFKMD